MPLVPFDRLPDDARTWVFGADPALGTDASAQLLVAVDEYLAQWHAHGAPLTVGRSLTDGRFLTIAVDQHTAGASGCSIDGMFRLLQQLERALGVALVGGGRVYYRDANGAVQCVNRDEFSVRAANNDISRDTTVYDTTVGSLGAWRAHFARPAGSSWHAQFMPDGARAG